MSQFWILNNNIFVHPFTCMVAGPTGCGKSTFIYNMIYNHLDLIYPTIDRIIICYSNWQANYELYKDLDFKVEFFKGLIDFELLDKQKRNLVIIDDLMEEVQNNQIILNLFTKDSHHNNISVIYVTQNLYSKGKYTRTMSLNSQYLVVFKNPRDQTQLSVLGRQMFPFNSKFLVNAYQLATENKPYGYLFIDLKQDTELRNRIQTGVLPGEFRLIFTKD